MLVEEIEEPHPTVGGGGRLEAVRTVAHERMAVVRIEDHVVCMVCRHGRDVLGRDVLVALREHQECRAAQLAELQHEAAVEGDEPRRRRDRQPTWPPGTRSARPGRTPSPRSSVAPSTWRSSNHGAQVVVQLLVGDHVDRRPPSPRRVAHQYGRRSRAAIARKPSAASRSAKRRIWVVRPRPSWATTTPAPGRVPGDRDEVGEGQLGHRSSLSLGTSGPRTRAASNLRT